MCDSGWEGSMCDQKVCPSGGANGAQCSRRGTCLLGTCACHAGFSGHECTVHAQSACPAACSGHGNCAVVGNGQAVCLCHSNFVGVACMEQLAACPGGCGGFGKCVTNQLTNEPECACFPGYSGLDCSVVCPSNCSGGTPLNSVLGGEIAKGRCSPNLVTGSTTQRQCICKEGFSGPSCEQMCPARCNGHGDCVNRECVCREGYTGVSCQLFASRTASIIFMEAIQGFYPLLFIFFLLSVGLCIFCCVGYGFNRWRGRFGTSAIPMWDYYAKRWRNAPLFEPIFAVPAATQTPPPPPTSKSR